MIEKIKEAIFLLKSLGSNSTSIVVTTSFITQQLLEKEFREKYLFINSQTSKVSTMTIFGAYISFDHFSNDIVIYDKTKACYDNNFIVTIKQPI